MGLRPLISAELPAAGGELGARAEDFEVEELPLYPPAGEGEHLFVRLRRSGWTTDALVEALARRLALEPRDVGTAGRKDRHAIATQTLSLPWPLARDPEEARRAVVALACEPLELARHGHKLRRGQHAGNRFRLRLRGAPPGALERARAILARLRGAGFANAFGPQRYGLDGKNAERGLALLCRGRRPRDPRGRLFLSAWQSERFDRWLCLRLERGLFARLLPGDLAQRAGGRATFVVRELAREQERLEAGEITFTGPLFGAEAPLAEDEAGVLERELLAESGIGERELRRCGLPGTRRSARLACPEVELAEDEHGLVLAFVLPPGAYATSLLEELCRVEARAGREDGGEGPSYTPPPAWLRPRQGQAADAESAEEPRAQDGSGAGSG